MPRTSVSFGEDRPDDAPHASAGLVVADGVYPSATGYRPIGSFQQFAPALSGSFLGGGAFISTNGNSRMIAGNATNLYSLSGGSWASKVGSLSTSSRWRFTQFGDDIICVNGGAPVDYNAASDSAALLTGSPPTADLCATVRDFVVLGRVNGSGNVVEWCGIGNATNWTIGSNQCGLQPIYAGGKIMGLTSGEVSYIIQRFQVVRMSYTGDATDPWQFDPISTNDGCIAEGSVVQAGALFFFRGDRGFTMFDGAQFRPIGTERIDRAFSRAYSAADLVNLWGVADPVQASVVWVINGKAWIYNWVLDRWAIASIPISAVMASFSADTALDSLDAIYGNLDSIPYSLDDPRFTGGTPRLTAIDANGNFGTLTGSNIEATVELPFIEFAANRQTRLQRVRPITDATDGMTLTADSRARLGDSEHRTNYVSYNSRGDFRTREAARSIQLSLGIRSGTDWSYLQGLEAEFAIGGRA